MALGGTLSTPAAAPAETDALVEPVAPPAAAKPAPVAPPAGAAAQAEALSALSNLGYGPAEAAAAVAEAAQTDPELETSGLIKAALRLLAPKG
jgi:Holliday junction DNA helicase RuvA